MTEQAFAQHFEISPQKSQTTEYTEESFLEEHQTPIFQPT